MKTQFNLKNLTQAAGLVLALGCSALPSHASDQDDKVSVGYLQVFSATQESQWGEGSYYYLHTGYRIFDAGGKEVKWVENHDTTIDETPQKVELAPGSYTIFAQSEKDGFVRLPVVVRLARTTKVDLESNRPLCKRDAVTTPKPAKTPSGRSVVMSN